MKTKLNILCACVLLALVLSTSTAVTTFVQMFSTGVEAGMETARSGKKIDIPNYKTVFILPTDMKTCSGTVLNMKDSTQVSIKPLMALVDVPQQEETWCGAISGLLSFIMLVMAVACVVTFFKLIWNINRGDIFSWKNVKFLRKLGWGLIIIFGCSFGIIAIGNYEAAQVLTLNGCKFSNLLIFSDSTFILGFIALLVAEVFAIGLRMKEEQDLTI